MECGVLFRFLQIKRFGLIPASPLHSSCNYSYRLHESGSSHVSVEFVFDSPNFVESLVHEIFLFSLNIFESPIEVLKVLYPLEVRNCYTARVCKNVRNEDDSSFIEHFVAFGSCR